jgi:hypothetical protein
MWPLSLIAIVVTLGLGYIWLTRGFFSSLIHMICTIIAGAIAFAVWEPISYWFLEASPTGGFTSFVGGIAWGLGLLIPFSVSLILLRLIVDKCLPANVVLQPRLDYIGGGVCGVMSGTITAGVLVISLSFFRLDSDVLGSPIAYGASSEGSSIVRGGGLWVPVDKWTADLYGGLSERAFRTGEPLAKWHPDVSEEGAGIRLSAFEGRGRNTTKTGDFSVRNRFTVGEGGGSKFSDMLKDRWDPIKAQRVVDPNKQAFPEDTHIEGFIVEFKAGAKEKDGKTAIGAGQLHLVLENGSEERMTVYPFAVSSQAEADKPQFARWRYDSDNVFIASTGGGAEAQMAFEFPCPPGYKPVALYIKGVRHDVDSTATREAKWKFRSAAERDAMISMNFGQIVSTGKGQTTTVAAGNIDASEATVLKRLPPPGASASAGLQPPEGMRISEMLPFIIQKGVHGNLELDEENNKNIILRGDATLTLDVLQNKGLEKTIQIQRMLTTPDTVIVQLDVGQGSKTSILGKSEDSGGNPPPALFDTNGTRYEPVGFIYQDETKVIVSFKPGEPITTMSQLPSLSRSRPAQKLTLIFRCSRGVNLKHFGLGNKALVTFDPPLLLDQQQGRGG